MAHFFRHVKALPQRAQVFSGRFGFLCDIGAVVIEAKVPAEKIPYLPTYFFFSNSSNMITGDLAWTLCFKPGAM